MTVGPLSVVRDAAPGTPNPHNLMLGDRLAQCISDHEATRIEAQLAGIALHHATAEADDWNITVTNSLTGWYLEQYGRTGTPITDSEGRALHAAIERWRKGGTLRVVDVGGTGLPRWPDLTELRAIVDVAEDVRQAEAQARRGPVARSMLLDAAFRLCYPDSDT